MSMASSFLPVSPGRRLAAIVVGVVLVLSGLFAIPSPARADIGDGSPACNVGEICFSRDPGNLNYLKHFYYHANHWPLSWSGGGGAMAMSASQVWNRDTECDIWVWNNAGANIRWPRGYSGYRDYWFIVMEHWPYGDWPTLVAAYDNKNTGHQRCGP
jgi:hypothetical protein